ncbi:MAG: hypothetical protein P9M15_06640, partial [Candidatus Electryoneaceae bacterium]|nr:hypothetical protein [Candidatus Electryoneaceae bacterium]
MNNCKWTVFTLVLIVFLVSTSAVMAQHWEPRVEGLANMSVLVTEALLDEETLVEGDEIGVFSPADLLCGAGVIPDGFPDERFLGITVWGNDADENEDPNGMEAREELIFRYWDADAGEEGTEFDAEIESCVDIVNHNPVEPIYTANAAVLVTLSGESGPEEPEIELSMDAYDFGAIVLEESVEWTLRIRNVGRMVLEVESITFEGDAVFAIEGDEAVDVDPREFHEVVITFTPEQVRDYEGTITIVSNDEDEGEVVVTLS